jgi:hypothetical protein
MSKPVEKKFPDNIIKYIKKEKEKKENDNNVITKVPTDFGGMSISMSNKNFDEDIKTNKKDTRYVVSFTNVSNGSVWSRSFKCKNDEKAKIECQKILKQKDIHDDLNGHIHAKLINKMTGDIFINNAIFQHLINENKWEKYN